MNRKKTVTKMKTSESVGAGQDEGPNISWDLDRLSKFAASTISQANLLARKSAVQLFRAGHALVIARDKLKITSAWCQWLEVQDFPRTSAWEAVKLYEKAGTEEAVKNLSLTQAKEHFGVTKPHRIKRAEEPDQTARTSEASFPRLVMDSTDKPQPSAGGIKPPFQGNPTPPPKEEPDSTLHVLSRIESRLQWLADEAEWKDQPSDQILRILNKINGTLEQIKKELSSAAA